MKYIKLNLEYLFSYGRGKKALLFFLIALLPGAFIAYFLPASKSAAYFTHFSHTQFSSFGKIWTSFMSLNIYSILGLLCSLLLLSISLACLTGLITRNMRVGDFKLSGLFLSVNDFIIPSICVVFLFTVLVLLLHTLFSALLLIWIYTGRILGLILSSISFLGIILTALYIFSSLNLWLPTMAFNGLYSPKVLGTAFYKSRSHQSGFFVAFLIPTLILAAFSTGAYFTQRIWFLSWILETLGYTLFLVAVIPQSFIIYCDLESISRADLSGYLYKRS